MVDLSTALCGIKLDNPVIAASGVFGYGHEFNEIYDINLLGSFSFKGTTLNERYGNNLPRIAEANSGLLNSVGLQNPGVEKVISEELPRLSNYYKKKVMANICGFSIDEYAKVCQRLNDIDIIGWFEINISCPNVHEGGMSFGTDEKSAYEVIKRVKEVSKKPVIAKLSPNVTDIVKIAKACESAGCDAVSLINTLLGMRVDLNKRKPILNNITGGLSGPAVFPVALRMVYEVYESVDIPIIGIGGISSARDVVEMMLSGATAVEIGTANLINPYACKEIIEDLPNVMNELNIDSLKECVGGAH